VYTRLGRWHCWLLFAGVNVTFFPLHILGFAGMPRRVYTYVEDVGWGELNLLATVGAFVIAVSILVFMLNVAISARRGVRAGADPWSADTLEWAAESPPAPYNFVRPPIVEGGAALWDRSPVGPAVVGLATDRREVIVTTTFDARPDNRHELPGPAIAPLFAALAIGVLFIGAVFTPWGLVVGSVLLTPALIGWGWPRKRREQRELRHA
jgi:cytochrome c oxidase subunit I+III